MDISNLAPIVGVNPRSQPFKLRWRPDRSKFEFSRALFDKLSLAYNSLIAHVDAKNHIVYLSVRPNNDGDFMKMNKSKKKGVNLTNLNLGEALVKMGYTGNKLNLIHEGAHEGFDYWKIIEDLPEDPEISSSAKPEEPTSASEVEDKMDVEFKEDKF